MAKNQNLHYVIIKVYSNQASKQTTWNNKRCSQNAKSIFHRIHDIENKLLIIIHANKMIVQKETIFSQTKPRAFS
jgi:hypothetical protein